LIVIKITIELTKMNDSDMILNGKTNRYVRKGSQTGKRLLKELASPPIVLPLPTAPTPPIVSQPTAPIAPVQTALLTTCADIVVENTPKFKNLTASETDALFKRLLLERLSIAPAKAKKPKQKKKSHYRVQTSSSSEESD
jgi:hypothetical protein